ncbi:DUF1015 domain-containing protein, partial [Flavobacteriaceae bacterium PRS1]
NHPETIDSIQKAFESISTIYIADGHHRSASSSLLSKEMKTVNNERYNFFMSYLIPESDLRIYELYRLIKGLNGLSKEEFLMQLDSRYRIENRGKALYQPTKKHHFSMYLDGEFYSLFLRKSNYIFNNALDALDTQILFKTILEPILGISDLRNDNRIDYYYGKNGLLTIKRKIDDDEFTVGFGLVPISIDEMKAIADQGLTMPPKSTFIVPKLRSGITIYEF